MKFKFSLLVWGLMMLPLGFSARGAETKISKVGVMKFEVGEELKASLGKFLSETFTSQLVGTKQYTVVDWEEIDRVLGLIAKSQPNVSAEDARKMAISQLGLEKMFLGRVDKLGSKYHLTVKLLGLDLRVERMERGTADNEEKLPEAVDQLGAAFLLDNSDDAKAKRLAEKTQAEAVVKAREEERLAEEKRRQETQRKEQEKETVQQKAVAQAAAEARQKANAKAESATKKQEGLKQEKLRVQAEAGEFSGKVMETMNAGGYTYVLVDTGGKEIWAAAAEFPVKVGETVKVSAGVPMKDFHSKSLNRDFSVVYFTGSIKRLSME